MFTLSTEALKPLAYAGAVLLLVAAGYWAVNNYIAKREAAAIESARAESNEQAREQEAERVDVHKTAAASELDELRAQIQANHVKLEGFRDLMQTNWNDRHQEDPDYLSSANAATDKQLRRAQASLDRANTPAGYLRETATDDALQP